MQLCNISWGEGMCGPICVNLMFCGRWSMDKPDALDVAKTFLVVLTCHSMRPFDLG